MHTPLQILTLEEVIQRVRLQKSWIYAAIKRNEFPAPIKSINARRTLFDASQIDQWIAKHLEGASQPANIASRSGQSSHGTVSPPHNIGKATKGKKLALTRAKGH